MQDASGGGISPKRNRTEPRPCPPSIGVDIKRQRVDAADQIGAKGGMHGAVALQAAHRSKGPGTDHHVEMCLTTFTPTAVPAMLFTVIVNCKGCWRKTCGQSQVYFVLDRHLSTLPPSIRCAFA